MLQSYKIPSFLSRATIIIALLLLSLKEIWGQTTRIWDGGGSNDRWTNATNWSGNNVPANGDDVVIPSGFNSITISRVPNITLRSFSVASTGIIFAANNPATTITISNANAVVDISGSATFGDGSSQNAVNLFLSNFNSATINGTLIIASNSELNLAANRTLTISGTLTKNGTFTANNSNSTVIYDRAGAQSIAPTIYNNLILTGSGTKTIATASTTVNNLLSMEGGATASASPTYGTNATLQYNTATSRNEGPEWITPFAASGGVIIANTGTISLSSSKTFNPGVPLVINSGSSLNTSYYDLVLGGNFTNNGSFNAGTGAVTFNGTAAQAIGGSSSASFNNLTINNSYGTSPMITLNNGQTVNGTLTMTAGIVQLGANDFTIGPSASITGGSSASYFIVSGAGGLIRSITATGVPYSFPVGDATGYSPVNFNFTAGSFSSATLKARVISAKHPDNGSTQDYLNRYWDIIPSGTFTSSSFGITCNYPVAGVSGTEGNMIGGLWDGAAWTRGSVFAAGGSFSLSGLTNAVSGTLNITGLDGAPPVVSSVVRAGTDPSSSSLVDFTVTFNENVSGVSNSNFTLTKTGSIIGESVTGITGTGSTRTVTVNTGSGNGTLRLDLTANLSGIADMMNNAMTASYSSGQFYTIDRVAPLIFGLSPADDAADVAPGDNLVLTFNEDVQAGSAGNIIIYNSTGTVFESIPRNDARISYAGNVVTVNPTANFSIGSGYYVLIDNNAIRDVAGNNYAGISSTSAWNFSIPNPYYRSRATGNWNAAGTWEFSYDCNTWFNAATTPTSANSSRITIVSGYTVSVTASVQADDLFVDGILSINSGQVLTVANGTASTDMTVGETGIVSNAGIITTTGTVVFNGLYTHNQNGGTIPTAGWNAGSTCNITGFTGTLPAGLGQSFSNFTFNCAARTLTLAAGLNVGGNLLITAGTIAATTQTISLGGNLTGAGALSFTSGTLNIGGDNTHSGTFTWGTGTVNYNGAAQQVRSTTYYNLVISNGNTKTLQGDVTVSNSLTMTQGNINAGTYLLTLSKNTPGSLSYTSGTIIGRFARAVSSVSSDYLFPVGTASYYRPAIMNFSLLSATNITAEFITDSPGSFTGYSDAGSSLINVFTEGFWRFSSPGSGTYALKLTGNGFSSFAVNDDTRITGRANPTTAWSSNNLGSHGSRSGNEISRTGVTSFNTTSFDFALAANCNAATMGYAYERDITIDHTKVGGGSDLFSFPMLIKLTGQSYLKTTSNGGRITSTNGYDIIFTDPDYGKLDHQIEYYNGTNGDLIAWVRIPVLSISTNTVIKILYSNPQVTTDPSVTSVWDTHYRGIWHFDNNSLADFTSYNKAATPYNTPTYPAGVMNNSLGLAAASKEYAVAQNAPHLNFTGNITISAWVYMNTRTRDQKIASNQNGTAGGFKFGIYDNNKVEFEIRNSSNTASLNRDVTGGTVLQTGTWYYLAGISSDVLDSIKTFVNGVSERPFRKTGILGSSSNDLAIGREPFQDSYYFDGRFDELRISDEVRSDGWMLTEYNNQSSPSSFYSVSGETSSEYLLSASMCSLPIPLTFGYPSGGTYSGSYVTGSSFSPPSAGTYQITYTYPGTCAGIVRNIEVSGAPSGPVAPNKQYCTGQIAYLEATTGTNIRWYDNNNVLVSTANPFSTGQTAVGSYTYKVSQTVNGCESTLVPVTLIISAGGVTINAQPQSASICLSNNATFTVVATGPNLTYSWRENTVPITDGGIYSGASTATLTLTNPGAAQNGKQYSCVITASCGAPASVTSNNATLTLTIPPVAAFNYALTPYCATDVNPAPTFTGGGSAGTFSAAPAGLVFVSTATGQVNLAASSPGDYTVTNTITSAGCVASASSPFSIKTEITWSGTSSTDWNTAANWECGIVPTVLYSVHVPATTNKPVLSAGSTGTVNNLTIESGASLTISGTLQISGAIANSGSFDASAGKIEFTGSSAQSIPAGTFAGNSVKDITINNSSGVTLSGPLNITGVLLLQNGDLASGDNLTLVSTAAGTACISGAGSGDVTGIVKMQRYLPSRFGYKYFSSPFQSSKVSEFAEEVDLGYWFPLFYRYNENQKYDTDWLDVFEDYSDPDNILSPMAGYAANLGDAKTPLTVQISGVVNNGDISMTMQDHGNPYAEQKYLVGNPYPSAIDWTKAGRTNLDNAVYFFKASDSDQWGGTYSSWVNGTASDGGSNIIPSMQGFLVRISSPAPAVATLTLDNSARVLDQTQNFFRKSQQKDEKSLLRLIAYFTGSYPASDAMVIYFDDKGTETFDNQVDAVKYFNTDYSVPNLFAVSSDQMKLSIFALPKPQGFVPVVPLGLKLLQDGEVVFKVRDIGGPYPWRSVNLVDSLRGITTNLVAGAEYKVTLSEGEYLNRFFLNIDGYGTGIAKDHGEEMIRLYGSGNKLFADINTLSGDKGMISVMNITGQVIFHSEIHSAGQYEFQPVQNDGIYIVSFISGGIRRTEKIFIRGK